MKEAIAEQDGSLHVVKRGGKDAASLLAAPTVKNTGHKFNWDVQRLILPEMVGVFYLKLKVTSGYVKLNFSRQDHRVAMVDAFTRVNYLLHLLNSGTIQTSYYCQCTP